MMILKDIFIVFLTLLGIVVLTSVIEQGVYLGLKKYFEEHNKNGKENDGE